MHADVRALAPAEVAELLRASGSAIIAEITSAPDDLLSWRPAPAEWCVKECLGHLIEAERRGFNGRIRDIIASPQPTIHSWDQQAVARARGDCERRASDMVTEFETLRADSVALVRNITDADLLRGGDHPHVGYLRVSDLLHEWVHHDRNHLRQLLANVQAFVWPTMGNSQKFAGE